MIRRGNKFVYIKMFRLHVAPARWTAFSVYANFRGNFVLEEESDEMVRRYEISQWDIFCRFS